MDYTAFSHGQILSKNWLIDHVEYYLYDKINIIILGGWYNVLGFMLFTKFGDKINHITNLDIDKNAIEIANKITEAYVMESKVTNVCANSNTLNNYDYDLVINCSPEHMNSDDWFTQIKPNKLVCLQSSNVTITEMPWNCINPNYNLIYFQNHYPLQQVLYSSKLEIKYSDNGYERYMLIGVS